jgi:hypothetical protein
LKFALTAVFLRELDNAATLAGYSTMTTAKEYRQFAEECLRWAEEADTEQDRAALLELARDWTMAAMRLEGVLVPAAAPNKEPPTDRHP